MNIKKLIFGHDSITGVGVATHVDNNLVITRRGVETVSEVYEYAVFTKEMADVINGRTKGSIAKFLKNIRTMEQLVDFCKVIEKSPYPKMWYDEECLVFVAAFEGKMHFEYHCEYGDNRVVYCCEPIDKDYENLVIQLIRFTSISE